ncbi:MAG: shikimate dehydrogenase [Bacteroidota bacterium]|jgi:shikimate dehydrogenase|nr:shikimate dehydrogenase [Bacteroidota bacterium]
MKIYGLIGLTLGHSFSQKYFTSKFLEENITDCQYQNFELKELDKEVSGLKKLSNLSGLNITIPYKSRIISYLDGLTDECREMNACNCIKIDNGKWIGYNTDVTGFEKSFLPHLKPFHKKALILGTGGSSMAVAFVLKKLGIQFLKVTRKVVNSSLIDYEHISEKMMEEYTVVINTTPVGMFPNIYAYPNIPYQYITDQHYFFDLIYNPPKTQFLTKAEEKGAVIENGEKMLVIQAEESWKIWNSIN